MTSLLNALLIQLPVKQYNGHFRGHNFHSFTHHANYVVIEILYDMLRVEIQGSKQ